MNRLSMIYPRHANAVNNQISYGCPDTAPDLERGGETVSRVIRSCRTLQRHYRGCQRAPKDCRFRLTFPDPCRLPSMRRTGCRICRFVRRECGRSLPWPVRSERARRVVLSSETYCRYDALNLSRGRRVVKPFNRRADNSGRYGPFRAGQRFQRLIQCSLHNRDLAIRAY